MKLIDAEELMKRLGVYKMEGEELDCNDLMNWQIKEAIEEAPAIEIVLCKECAYSDTNEDGLYCDNTDFWELVSEDHFCSLGKPRQGRDTK